ncbi:tonB-system energizer ExbB [Nitrobacter sp. NHB1]|uniref:tonB-system energizer ExbB n=1 Tax=Nitrobacter sp. NHB1 TaxID=3119830 RepID=UPI002FFF2036
MIIEFTHMKLSLNFSRTTGRNDRTRTAKASAIALASVLMLSFAPHAVHAQSLTRSGASGTNSSTQAPPTVTQSTPSVTQTAQPASQQPASQVSPDANTSPAEQQAMPAATAEQQTPPATELAEAPESSPILPHELTPIGMFMAADYIVKSVMVGLALASVVTWSVWLAKTIELLSARSKLMRDIRSVEGVRSLEEANNTLQRAGSDIAILTHAARDEIRRSQDAMNHDGIKERVASLFSRIEAAAARRMTRGTSILATIGSTAPFVGLFGTVWGIMNAFIGISKSQTTNLAVVAPGIAEALLATAMGLVAAIPAVMIYNMFSRSITGYRGLLADGSAELMRMVSRDLNRAEMVPHQRAAE